MSATISTHDSIDVNINVSSLDIGFSPTPYVVNSLSISPNGRFLSILCDNGVVLVLDLSDNMDILSEESTRSSLLHLNRHKILNFPISVRAHCFSSSSSILVVCTENAVVVFETDEFKTVQRFPVYFIPSGVAAFSPSEESLRLAVAGAAGVHLYTFPSREKEERGVLHEHLHITMVKFSRSGSFLGVASLDGHVGVWLMENLSLWFDHYGSERITSIDFSPDERRFVVASWDGSISIYTIDEQDNCGWRAQPPLLKMAQPANSDSFALAAFTPSCDHLCTYSASMMKLYDVDLGGSPLKFFHGEAVSGLAISNFSGDQEIPLSFTMNKSGVLMIHRIPLSACAPDSSDSEVKLKYGDYLLIISPRVGQAEIISQKDDFRADLACIFPSIAHSIYPSGKSSYILCDRRRALRVISAGPPVGLVAHIGRWVVMRRPKGKLERFFLHDREIEAGAIIGIGIVALLTIGERGAVLSGLSLQTAKLVQEVHLSMQVEVPGEEASKYNLFTFHRDETLVLVILSYSTEHCDVITIECDRKKEIFGEPKRFSFSMLFQERKYHPRQSDDGKSIEWLSLHSKKRLSSPQMSFSLSLERMSLEISAVESAALLPDEKGHN